MVMAPAAGVPRNKFSACRATRGKGGAPEADFIAGERISPAR